MDNSSAVIFNQVWKHKHLNEKIKIVSHVCQDIWDCEYLAEENRIQITEGELLANWKLIRHQQPSPKGEGL